MSVDSIERQVRIDAPVEVVWRVVTQPEQITQWFSDEADIEVREGGAGTMTWTDKATTQRTTVSLVVVRVDEPNLFSYRWGHPDGAQPDASNSLLVEFSLTPAGDGTLLRVVESGLAGQGWTEEAKTAYLQDHDNGWAVHLERLQVHAPAMSAAGTSRRP